MQLSTRWTRGVAMGVAMLALASPLRAQQWFASLDGPSESPPNVSPATGFATFFLSGTNLSISIVFADLLGPTTASHIHCCTTVPGAGTAGVATQTPFFIGFPIGVTSGTYSHVFDLALASSYNPAFVSAHGGSVAASMTDLINGMNSGTSYLNIHTTFRTGGEIRGFITPTPEPGTVVLVATGVVGLVALRRRRA